MARKRLLSKSIAVDINLDGVEYAFKSLPLDNKLLEDINWTFVRYCDDYVPFKTGALSDENNITVTAKSITYNAPYARYQYYGKVYGPNLFKGYNPDGTPRFHTPPGTVKYPTGNYLTYNTEFHPLATSEWDKAMMMDRGEEFTAAVTDLVAPVIIRKARVEAAKAAIW